MITRRCDLCYDIDIYPKEEALFRKTTGLIGMIAGLVIVVVSLLADIIGIGTYPGFNTAQLAGILIGLAFFVIGYLLRRLKPKVKKPAAK